MAETESRVDFFLGGRGVLIDGRTWGEAPLG